MKENLREIASHFALEGPVTAIDSLGEGFINDTFIVRTEADAPDYILQRKNKAVFPDVPAMMDNIRRVTEHIRRRVIAAGGDPRREVMTVVPAKDGHLYHVDAEGEYWAATVFIDDTVAYNKADSPELARKGGEGIGKFQSQLDDFTEPLAETIKGFHNIRHRFGQWDAALARDAAGRRIHLAEEIGWIESRRAEMLSFWSKVEDGTIPTRVTHNDTKINNILFDKQGEVLCAIDLDTVMASTSLNDFGDAIRSYANTGDEDDRDLSRVGTVYHVRTGFALPDGLHRRRHLLQDKIPRPQPRTHARPIPPVAKHGGTLRRNVPHRGRDRGEIPQRIKTHKPKKTMQQKREGKTIMEIRKITGVVPADKRAVEAAFDSIEPQPVACCNWPEQYPYAPEVSFRMFHTGAYLMLRFDVAERWTMARVTEDNGEVWTDSCVEFFIAPDDSGYYYNFECTCIGRLLVGFRREREHATHATPRVMESILRNPSLGPRPFPEHEGDNRWSVVLAIPPQALFMHSLTDWSGLKAKVNLYKCGDKLSQPHFLSWKPIAAPKPDFHLPEFFEQIKFSKI